MKKGSASCMIYFCIKTFLFTEGSVHFSTFYFEKNIFIYIKNFAIRTINIDFWCLREGTVKIHGHKLLFDCYFSPRFLLTSRSAEQQGKNYITPLKPRIPYFYRSTSPMVGEVEQWTRLEEE